MNRFRSIIVGLFASACALQAAPTTAQPLSLTLPEARRLALEHSPTLAAAAAALAAREAGLGQAKALPNPELEYEVENLAAEGDDGAWDAAESTLLLSQLVELGGKRGRRIDLAGGELELARAERDGELWRVIAGCRIAFVDLLAAQAQDTLMAETLTLAENVLGAVSAKVEAGKVSPLELDRVRVERSAAAIRRDRAARRLQTARERLAAVWGGSPQVERALGDLTVHAAIPDPETLEGLLASSPTVARLDADLATRRAQFGLERSLRMPDLTLSGGVQKPHAEDRRALVLGLALPLPLFDRNGAGAQAAGEDLVAAEQSRRAELVSARTELRALHQELLTVRDESLVLQIEALPAAERAFAAAEFGYREGKFDLLAVLDTQRLLAELREQHVSTLADYHRLLAELSSLVGADLHPESEESSR